MNPDSGLPASAPPPGQSLWRRIIRWPSTQLGWWSVGLAAGIVGLIVVIRRHERSWLVWLAILPGLFTLFFVLGEFLVPH